MYQNNYWRVEFKHYKIKIKENLKCKQKIYIYYKDKNKMFTILLNITIN